MNFNKIYESYINSIQEETVNKKVVNADKMTKLLNIPRGKDITDVYTSGMKLAKDLVKATDGDQKKAAGMLAYAAFVDKDQNVYDDALRALKKF